MQYIQCNMHTSSACRQRLTCRRFAAGRDELSDDQDPREDLRHVADEVRLQPLELGRDRPLFERLGAADDLRSVHGNEVGRWVSVLGGGSCPGGVGCGVARAGTSGCSRYGRRL